MFLPYSTDAPVYYWPFTTVSMILVNVLAFAYFVSSPEGWDLADSLSLFHGRGLHPLQWITSNFVHADIVHLSGNMIFLWVFGLVVEGKVGWYWFLLIYMGIGVSQCALEQTALLGAGGGGSCGASAIIFGLLGISVVWAPMNDVRFFYFLWYGMIKTGLATVTVRTMAIIYIGLELVFGALEISSGEVGSSILHLSGAVLGLAVGVILLKKNLVDCEGWDIFSIRHGRPGKIELLGDPSPGDDVEEDNEEDVEEDNDEDRASDEAQRETALELMDGYLAEGDAVAACAVYRGTAEETGAWELPEDRILTLIKALQSSRAWNELKPLLEETIRRFPRRASGLKLLLARILIEAERRPARALAVLEEVPQESLSSANARVRKKLINRAQEMRAEGVLELDED